MKSETWSSVCSSDDMKFHYLSFLITTMLSPILQILLLQNPKAIPVMTSNIRETGNSMKVENLTIHFRPDAKVLRLRFAEHCRPTHSKNEGDSITFLNIRRRYSSNALVGCEERSSPKDVEDELQELVCVAKRSSVLNGRSA